MKQFGLIGYPLAHSFSKKYFTQKFEQEGIEGCSYDLFPLEHIAAFPALLESNPHLSGLNVTIPHKQAIMPFLDRLDETAAAVGTVNTIKIANGKLTGYNTDVHGFEKSLLKCVEKAGLKQAELKAIVLGSGGASKAVVFVLKKHRIPFQIVSRQAKYGTLTYPDLENTTFSSFSLVVNTTPLGMAPKNETCPPLPYRFAHPGQLFFDLVYNPEKTLFLARAAAKGAFICNGLQMLHLQAEKAWEIWKEEQMG
ncbi:MAG: shikimate dehydrogenase [Saprospiraceae bacterium]